MPEGEVILIHRGEECDVEWKILEFLSLPQAVAAFYQSPDFFFEGESWKLLIYPFGRGGFITLRLCRVSSNGLPMKIKFSFGFKTVKGKKYSQRYRARVFEGDSYHDVNRFMSISQFERIQAMFLVSRSLTVVCTLITIASTESASDDATAGCSYSKRSFDVNTTSPSKKCCKNKSIKFLDRSPLTDLQNSQMASVKEEQSKIITGHYSPQECRISPDSGVSIHLEALSRDLSKLLNKSSNCDVRIACEGQIFNAHRIILGVRSTFFSAMFENEMVEGETGLIKVEDFSASILQSFLKYLYCGILPEMNVETAKQFYEIADKYGVEELKQTCSGFLAENLSKNNACEILVIADQHSDEDFRKNIISYIVEEKIPQHDCWQDFSKSYPLLAVQVLNLYVRKNGTN